MDPGMGWENPSGCPSAWESTGSYRRFPVRAEGK